MESDALALWTYECRVVPGLLQTDAYARAVTSSVPPVKDEEQVSEQVAARMARASLLERKPPIAMSFIIEQALIDRWPRRDEGPHQSPAGTLHTIQRGLQIMPLHQPDHSGFDGPLMMSGSPDNRWYRYVEGQRGGLLVTDPKEVSIMLQRYAELRSQALNPEDSRSLLRRLRGAL